jgi:hypothetical protein
MPNYAEYFEKKAYKPKYYIGDRVFGYYKKIPFIGSVGNDSVVSEIEGPRISVHLDLPMIINQVILVKHKDIKSKLVNYDSL